MSVTNPSKLTIVLSFRAPALLAFCHRLDAHSDELLHGDDHHDLRL